MTCTILRRIGRLKSSACFVSFFLRSYAQDIGPSICIGELQLQYSHISIKCLEFDAHPWKMPQECDSFLFHELIIFCTMYTWPFPQPEWKLADPLCTFVFSTMVAISSSKIIYDALAVMMEG